MLIVQVDAPADHSIIKRVWTPEDGIVNAHVYCAEVRPSGVWSYYPNSNSLTFFDGYTITRIPAEDCLQALGEYPQGQFWARYAYFQEDKKQKMFEYRFDPDDPADGEWIHHDVKEIENVDYHWKKFRGGFIPVKEYSALFLLQDWLFEYDFATKHSEIIKTVTETNLIEFRHLDPARDGGYWIAGLGGITKIEGEKGIINTQSNYSEFLFDSNPINFLCEKQWKRVYRAMF